VLGVVLVSATIRRLREHPFLSAVRWYHRTVGTDGARFEVIDSNAVSSCWLLASVSKTLLRQRLFKVLFDTGFDSFVSDQRLVVLFVCDIILESSTIR